MDIRNKVALVTGASVGTGRAIARRLATEGAAVVLADIDCVGGEQTRRMIRDAGGDARFIAADMCSETGIARMIDFAVTEAGGLDILVNNAGGGGHVPPHFPDATPAQWGALLDLNLRGPMLATQLAITAMQGRHGGVIVNVASTAGLGHRSYQSPEYGAAKAGLIRFTSSLTGLRERTNVRVVCIAPDWVGTERALRELAAMTGAQRATVPDPIPMAQFTDAVVELVRDDRLDGRVLVLLPGQSAQLLDQI
ncbi:SDR family NAD(P)-dependent oxidoreductase [Actinoplanes sp. NPDC089786]|uniref:SDR family NAD(P)-dependent oxidoreductase n=1 Tax=Actinoplanes sp. NPDC089786 TaxID=3155185 RepID=UPI00341A251E